MSPSKGRIVLYRFAEGGEEVAAIVCGVHSDTTVNIRTFPDEGGVCGWATSVPLQTSPTSAGWRWPQGKIPETPPG